MSDVCVSFNVVVVGAINVVFIRGEDKCKVVLSSLVDGSTLVTFIYSSVVFNPILDMDELNEAVVEFNVRSVVDVIVVIILDVRLSVDDNTVVAVELDT